MATGASTADAAIVLIDARKGVLVQSRRHAYITSLLGVRHVIVAVNKMDLVDYDEARFLDIQKEFSEVLAQINADAGSDSQAYFVPVSALVGRTTSCIALVQCPGTRVPHCCSFLKRFPQQCICSVPRSAFQCSVYCALTSIFVALPGRSRPEGFVAGEKVTVLPSGRSALVKRIVTFDGDLPEAHAPLSVTLVLDEELDVSRGDLLVAGDAPTTLTKEFKASLVWMDHKPLDCDRRYLLKHTSQTVPIHVSGIEHGVDIRTLEHTPSTTLEMNAIGVATLRLLRPIALDRYAENRFIGAFILIDPETNSTVAAGMVAEVSSLGQKRKSPFAGAVCAEERIARWGHGGGVITLSGPAETIDGVERALFAEGAVTLRTARVDDAEWIVEAGDPAAGCHAAGRHDVFSQREWPGNRD